ncbi:MAG: aminotransferase class I/II-fold pyridoxal phosphate-dependent enzyme [Magnetococcales bacterium]|nr:aminotransferase class I/II-fold pyridoxal phosphate-dependent enzyme [Magnetococcales bacterium]
MIPLAVPDLTGNEGKYLQECIESTFVSSVGPFVTRFEEEVAQASGSRQCVATASGTAGLHTALVALGVGAGDLVILPSLTFIGSANAIAYCRADPWLLDVSADGWNLDPEGLKACLVDETETREGKLIHRQSGRRVAGIMPVHVLGNPAQMDPIMALARQYGLPVVADGAAALGARYKGRAIGDLGADLTVFSFNGNKTITAGGGGGVVGENRELLELVRHLTTTARVGSGYDHDRVGFNYRMTNLQAAVGCAQMERLESLVVAKQRIRDRYESAFQGLQGISPFPISADSVSACWFSGMVVENRTAEEMEKLRQRLREAGIDARPFWKPIHLQAPYRQAPRSGQGVSESVWWRILPLPCSSGMVPEEQEKIIALTREALR